MLFRSRTWVRTWIGALVYAALVLARPAVSRTEPLSNAGLSATMMNAAQTFVAAPNAANLQAVRSILVCDRAYDPYSADLAQLDRLVHAARYDEAIALFTKSLPNLMLSPRAHDLASAAAAKSGDKSVADSEHQFALCCLKGVLETGDGSQSRPFLVARLSDEADLLDAQFNTQIHSQSLLFQGDKKFDRILGKDGRTYWFDVSMLLNRPLTVADQLPVAAADGPAANTQAAVVHPAAPPSTPALQNTAAKAAAQRGLDAYRAGRYDEALSSLNKAIALEPKNAGIRVDRGNIRYARRDYTQAIVDFSEATRLDPNYATAYSNRAFALSTLGDQDQAITDFNTAIRLQANYGRAYNGRGCAYQAKEMLDTAIADFDVAIRLNPSYAAAYENRSSAYAKKGNKTLADADAAKARQLRGAKDSPAPSATASSAPRGN